MAPDIEISYRDYTHLEDQMPPKMEPLQVHVSEVPNSPNTENINEHDSFTAKKSRMGTYVRLTSKER